MKKQFSKISIFAVIFFITTSCATILSGTKADIKVTSNIPNSKVYSVNKEEQLTELGTSPCVITMDQIANEPINLSLYFEKKKKAE